MAGTRSSTKSNPKQNASATAGEKRKADDATSPEPKRDHKAAKQMSIEESMSGEKKHVTDDSEMKEAPKEEEVPDPSLEDQEKDDEIDDHVIAETGDSGEAGNVEEGGAVQESKEREEKMASNILEKGII
jgi:uroporphyrinogen-III synthase